jgi:hypothetical protein
MREFNPRKSSQSVLEIESKRTLRQGMKGGLILRSTKQAGPCLFNMSPMEVLAAWDKIMRDPPPKHPDSRWDFASPEFFAVWIIL